MRLILFGGIDHFDYVHQYAEYDQYAEHNGHVDDGNQKRIVGYRTHSFHLLSFVISGNLLLAGYDPADTGYGRF